MKIKFLLVVSLLIIVPSAFSQSTDPETKRIFGLMKRVADWQWNTLETAGWKNDKKDWTNGALYAGMMAWAKVANDETYYRKLIQVGEDNNWRIGKYRQCADDYCVGQMYSQLFSIYKDNKYIEDFKSLADTLVALPHDESLEWKNKVDLREWAWCDALFMGPPALAYLSQATGDPKYLDKASWLWWKSTDYLYDKKEHLYYRDSRYFTRKENNGAKVFWSRGNGWVMGGLVRVLSVMPEDHPDRPRFVRLYKEMTQKIAALQQADGSWYASLLDPGAYPVKETSGTGFYCYALAWGINKGILPYKKYGAVVQKAWQALVTSVHEDGKLGYVQAQGASPDKVGYDDTDVYGVGAFLLAGSEMMQLTEHRQTNGDDAKARNTMTRQKNETLPLLRSMDRAPATGLADREFWVKTLYRIAYPVIHNLALGSLKRNMPLETGPQYYSKVRDVTYLEALGRTVAGLAPWLALPDDATKEGLLRQQLREEVIKGLTNAADPSNPDYLNFDVTDRQPIVDGAYLAQAFLRAPQALWAPLDDTTKRRYIAAFKSLRNRSAAYNNWLLFAGMCEAFLLSIGEQDDPARIQFALNKLKEWYAGDGWFSDGPKFSMDYYNSYVMHPMLTDLLKVLVSNKKADQADYDLELKRMVRYSEFLERSIAPDGAYPVYGRSITYRTAAFQALAQTALMEKLPAFIKPAQVRCALTKVMHNLYDNNQNFDKDGWLVLGFNGHQPEIADSYTSTGSLYMATLGFLALGLPAGNPFWNEPPAPWSSVKAWSGQSLKKDYKVEY